MVLARGCCTDLRVFLSLERRTDQKRSKIFRKNQSASQAIHVKYFEINFQSGECERLYMFRQTCFNIRVEYPNKMSSRKRLVTACSLKPSSDDKRSIASTRDTITPRFVLRLPKDRACCKFKNFCLPFKRISSMFLFQLNCGDIFRCTYFRFEKSVGDLITMRVELLFLKHKRR